MNETEYSGLPLPKYEQWTLDSFECYLRDCNCKGCPMTLAIKGLSSLLVCRIKDVVANLLGRGIKPPLTRDEVQKHPEQINLVFGADATKKIPRSRFAKFKICNNYEPAKHTEMCKNCTFLRKKKANGRTHYKCLLMGVTNSPASDIRLNCVCSRFKENKKNENNT